MTDPEYRAITNFYLCDDGLVNYVEFIKDTTPDIMTTASETDPKPQTQISRSGLTAVTGFQTEEVSGTQTGGPRANGNSREGPASAPNYSYMPDIDVDPMKVLERIKRDVRISRTRLREFLQDFDTLRKGTMTTNKFFGSLDKLK